MISKKKSYKESAEEFMKGFDRTQELAQKEKDGTLTPTDTAIGIKVEGLKKNRDLVNKRLFQTIRASESKKTDSLKIIIAEIVKENPLITHSSKYNYARSELIAELENNYKDDVEIIKDSSISYLNRSGEEQSGKHIVWYRPNGTQVSVSFKALDKRLRKAKQTA